MGQVNLQNNLLFELLNEYVLLLSFILKTFKRQADGKEIAKKTKKERWEEKAERKLII